MMDMSCAARYVFFVFTLGASAQGLHNILLYQTLEAPMHAHIRETKLDFIKMYIPFKSCNLFQNLIQLRVLSFDLRIHSPCPCPATEVTHNIISQPRADTVGSAYPHRKSLRASAHRKLSRQLIHPSQRLRRC